MKFDNFFFQQGFIKGKSDPNIYINKDEHGNFSFISSCVDDLIITRSATSLIDEIKRQLSQEFEMKASTTIKNLEEDPWSLLEECSTLEPFLLDMHALELECSTCGPI
jgi:hypothetical protein